jgi:biopolymer transport protein ExbD
MNPLRFPCPGCGKRLTAPEAAAGRQSSCPKCGTRVTIPSAPAAGEKPTGATPPPGPKETASEHALLLMPPRESVHADLIDMTAMVDIVFFLLIFFLVTSMQSLESVISLPSPQQSSNTSAVAQPTDYLNDPTYIVVTIDQDDVVYVEQEEAYGEQGLRSKLRAARQEDPERTGMLVIGDPDATHGKLVSVLDAGADAGIKELLYSVSESPDDTGG